MKQIVLIWIAVLLMGNLAKADSTFVTGTVSGEWTIEHSPYVVTGDLFVLNDTLVIDAGVRVYFAGRYEALVQYAGLFEANGTEDDSIVFTSAPSPDSLRWGGVTFDRCTGPVRLNYCVFENATGRTGVAGVQYETTSDPDGTTPDIGAFYFDQTPSAADNPVEIVKEFSLLQNYPNPFNGETTIEFEVAKPSLISLELYDITGRLVRTLYQGNAEGRHSVHVVMNDLASGVYIYRLRGAQDQISNKMLLIR